MNHLHLSQYHPLSYYYKLPLLLMWFLQFTIIIVVATTRIHMLSSIFSLLVAVQFGFHTDINYFEVNDKIGKNYHHHMVNIDLMLSNFDYHKMLIKYFELEVFYQAFFKDIVTQLLTNIDWVLGRY